MYLYYCLLQKNQRKENTIEAALYPMIANAISQYENEVFASELWNLIKDGIDGTPDKRKPNEYPSIRLWHYSQKYNHKYHMQ
jgi:hypothetical protein